MKVTDPHRSFVGRRAELDEIAGALALDARPRPIRTVCVAGPAGIGKTRLAEQLSRRVAASGATVCWARCWNGPGTPALWPWNQLLAELGVTPVTTEGRRDRFAAFHASVEAARAASTDRAVMLVVDDIHWADPASLDILHLLSRDPVPSGLSLVVTHREPEAVDAVVAEQLAAIEREAFVTRLSGLPLGAVGELIGLLGGVTDPAFVGELHRRTGGNPFFVSELVRAWSTDPDVPLPSGVRAAIAHHLGLVGESVRRVLGTAAVQGREFDAAVVAAAEHLDGLGLAALLRAARDAGLAARVEGTAWRFEHALIGEYLIAGLTPHELARRHLHTADAIELVGVPERPDQAESLANHLAAAGALCPPARLLAAARAAAERAGAQLAWEDQSHHLATAVGAARADPETPPEQVIELLIGRCEAEKHRRRLDVAHDLGMEAAALARRLADPRHLARVALTFPPDVEAIEIDDIYDAEQRPLRDEALAALGDTDPLLRAQLQATLALSLYWETPTGDRAESHLLSAARRDELTADALAAARRLDDDRTRAIALNARIYANWGPASRMDRPALAEELITVATRLGEPDLALSGRVWRVADLLERGRLAEADRHIDAFERDARRIRSRRHLWTVARWRANRALMSGDLEAAEQLAETALALGCEIMPPDVAFHFYTTTVGPIHYLRGTLGDSLDYLRDTAASSPNVPAWQVGVAVAAANSGDLDMARAQIEPCAADDFARLPRDLNFVPTIGLVANVAYLLGDAALGAAAHGHLAPYSGRLAVHGTGYASYGAIDLALGECAAAMGDRERARAYFEAAHRQLAPTGSPYVHVAELFLGRLLEGDDPDAARRYLVAARDGFVAAGLGNPAAQTSAVLADLDARRRITLAATSSGWQLRRPDRPAAPLANLKGFRALAELVVHPNQPIAALDLAAVIEGRAPEVRAPLSDEPVLDRQAVREYRRRVEQLRGQLDRADIRGDAATSQRVARELAALAGALEATRGFGGHPARMRTDADRARVNVTKHIKRAISRIAEQDAELGRHLGATVTTGSECCYATGRGRFVWAVTRE
jgi:hypothetical protein